MNNLILDALEQTAARLPEKIAFADEQTEVSFSALVRRAQSVAAALIPLVGKGDFFRQTRGGLLQSI